MKRAQHQVMELPQLAAAVGAALTFLVPHSVLSQTNDVATLEDFRACGALQRDSARLACFDGVLAADRTGGGVDENDESAPVTQPAEPEAPVAAAEPEEDVRVATEPDPEPAEIPAPITPRPEPADAAAATEPASEPTEEQPPIDPPAELAPAQVASAPREEASEVQTASAARSRPAESLGASEDRAASVRTQAAAATRAERAEPSAFMIVQFNTRMPGAARFVSDDGRVFVQTSGGSNYRTFPDVPFQATLEDGALGSNFLRLGPRLRVRVRIVE